jgi:DNA mismatch endonuclease (patch repair protein)
MAVSGVHQGYRHARIPTSRREFWEAKLAANVARDVRAVDALLLEGGVFWWSGNV